MTCDKCGCTLRVTNICPGCGHDNSGSDRSAVPEMSMRRLRSSRITIFIALIMLLGGLHIYKAVAELSEINGAASLPVLVAIWLFIALCAAEMVLAFFIFRMKKWAVFTYIGISAFAGVLQILSGDYGTAIFRLLLLYFIFSKDWEYFE